MIFKPARLGKDGLSEAELVRDKKGCRRFGPCGVGEKALYLNSFYIDRRYYVPFRSVTRVFKRVAMSKGGFTGKGVFGSIPYLVVEYDGGREKQCIFKYEEQVDLMLACLKRERPGLPLMSQAAQARLRERDRLRAAKKKAILTEEEKEEIRRLNQAKEFLEKKPELSIHLGSAAKALRVNERTNPTYKWVALAMTLLGAAAAVYGVYSIVTGLGYGLYFTLFGLAAIFFFAGANVLPTARNNKRYVRGRLETARKAVEGYISGYPDFPLPARYAHPIVLRRMIRAIEEGKAEDAGSALEAVKADLKALNADVQVEQDEYDEVVAVKPMFLIEDYR